MVRKSTKAQRTLAADWNALQLKWASVGKFARTNNTKLVKPELKPEPQKEVSKQKIKSLVTAGGSTALPEKKIYTGDKIIGIATMHKSNLIPIFEKQAAEDVAKMRRG